MKDVRVFGFWLVACQAASYYLATRYGHKGVRAALGACFFIWLGFIIAISFTEAWTKFKSKLLERQVGLDVGRLVFDALNTLETVCCVTALSLLFRFESDPFREEIWAIPVVLALILLLQVLYLTPRLELRAFFITCEELAKKKHATKADEAVYKEYKALTTLRRAPSTMLHQLYIVLEIVKVGLLFKAGETMLFTQ